MASLLIKQYVKRDSLAIETRKTQMEDYFLPVAEQGAGHMFDSHCSGTLVMVYCLKLRAYSNYHES